MSRFKVGDIITPKRTRTRSNDYALKNLKKLRVESLGREYDARYDRLECKILEGTTKDHYGTTISKTHRGTIRLYCNAFDLATQYDLYPVF